MDEKAPHKKSRVKLSPAASHRRQMTWQVWVPLIASILIVLALLTLTVIGAFGGSSEVARWSNISAIWIIAPLLLVGLIFFALAAAMVFGMAKLLNKVPDWMLRLQLLMEQLTLAFRRMADASTMPVMVTSGYKARAAALWQSIRKKPARGSQAGNTFTT